MLRSGCLWTRAGVHKLPSSRSLSWILTVSEIHAMFFFFYSSTTGNQDTSKYCNEEYGNCLKENAPREDFSLCRGCAIPLHLCPLI